MLDTRNRIFLPTCFILFISTVIACIYQKESVLEKRETEFRNKAFFFFFFDLFYLSIYEKGKKKKRGWMDGWMDGLEERRKEGNKRNGQSYPLGRILSNSQILRNIL